MDVDLIDRLGMRLAHNRQAGTTTELHLHRIQSLAEAEAIQLAATEAYGAEFDGFAITGASAASRNSLNFDRPIYSPVPDDAYLADDCRLQLPLGVIGAQCEFLFVLGQPILGTAPEITRESVVQAVGGCQPAIGILGRRTHHDSLDYLAAVADFALHVATIRGPLAQHPDLAGLDAVQVTARINDQVLANAPGSAIMGHPIEAVAWLARELAQRGLRLNAGDMISTGSCTPILQVLPGQRLSVDFGALGAVSCRFE
jgi:2-keto-4-pentenoate hydratase